MRIAAGVMQIVSGAISLLVFIIIIVTTTLSGSVSLGRWDWWNYFSIDFSSLGLIPIIIIVLAVGILPLIGGIFALQRKSWGVALAGSIVALFPTFIMGVLAIIFIGITKNEFE